MEAQNISSRDLMERASRRLVDHFVHLFKEDRPVWIFVGPGNNGGDGWCMARLLSEKGYSTCVVHLIGAPLSPDNEANKKSYLKGMKGKSIGWPQLPDPVPDNLIIIDSLFGTGLSRALGEPWDDMINTINGLGRTVCSIDVPSGLHTENGIIGPAIRADHTLSIHSVKLSYLLAECHPYVGKWAIIDIDLDKSEEEKVDSSTWLVDSIELERFAWRHRSAFDHKGKFGHAMIIGGSKGMMGAAVLATKACLRSGSGLTTALVPGFGLQVLQQSCPEAMALADCSQNEITEISIPSKVTAIGVGPGLGVGAKTRDAIKRFLEGEPDRPLVLDADALNIIASEGLVPFIPDDSILTPHPGEFDRLFGQHETGMSRVETQRRISQEQGLYIVLKGRYTSISSPDGNVYFNGSGSPALAKGGSGDILTGMITAILARTLSPLTAAILGVYLHGLAGEMAEMQFGEESVIGTDVIKQIGNAFKEVLK